MIIAFNIQFSVIDYNTMQCDIEKNQSLLKSLFPGGVLIQWSTYVYVVK